ncbi:hypothetical protein ACFLYZ_00875 [Thermodesulfobacteriota bacterium]
MDAVSCGAHDFRHIGPHGIKTGAHKRTAITGPGNRNFTGVGLVPEPVNNIRAPVIISQGPIIRIDDSRKDSPGAVLNTAKAALAGVQVFRFVHGAAMLIVVFENSIDAFFFDAFFAAAGAVFPEFNRGVLADGMKPRRRCFCWNMILFGHRYSKFRLMNS